MVNFHSSATTVLALFATLSAFDKVQAQGSSGGDKRAGRVGREDTTGANNDDRRVEFTVVDAEGNNAEENIQVIRSFIFNVPTNRLLLPRLSLTRTIVLSTQEKEEYPR